MKHRSWKTCLHPLNVCKEFVCLRCSTVVGCVNGNTSDMLTDIPQHHPDEKKHILLLFFFFFSFCILFTKLTPSVYFHMWQKRILRIKINQGLRILHYGTLCLNPLYVLSPPLSSFTNSQCTSLLSPPCNISCYSLLEKHFIQFIPKDT